MVVKTEHHEWVGPLRTTRSAGRLSPSAIEVVEVESDDEGFASATECGENVRRDE